MTDKPTGGLAFPTVLYGPTGVSIGQDRGMTLRDWFAGQALAGYTANIDVVRVLAKNLDAPADAIVRMAYRAADAMLAERDK